MQAPTARARGQGVIADSPEPLHTLRMTETCSGVEDTSVHPKPIAQCPVTAAADGGADRGGAFDDASLGSGVTGAPPRSAAEVVLTPAPPAATPVGTWPVGVGNVQRVRPACK